MKTTLRLIAFLLFVLPARAEEGMWIPALLKKLNEGDMRARGLKLTAEEIYSINKSSLKDAIVLFDQGCTGELIGREGLLLTNHHCGFEQIQSHSAVGKNYIDDGFWAKSKAEELRNPGTTAAILQRMEDVTAAVEAELAKLPLGERAGAIPRVYTQLQDAAVAGTHLKATVKPLFYGSVHYLYVYEVFTDVRLVGAPPAGIGKFGGDTDNWEWPRHTGDFSLFRIYTGPDGRPAEPSDANIPYKPKRFLSITLGGLKPGDFTMVYGYPARTQEYLTSHGVRNIAQRSDPFKVALRRQRLDIIAKYSGQSEAVRIQYAAKQASIANAWKKWLGEMKGLTRLNTVAEKQKEEARLTAWIDKDPAQKLKYGGVLPKLDSLYQVLDAYILPVEYMREAVQGTEVLGICGGLEVVYEAIRSAPAGGPLPDKAEAALKKWEAALPEFYKDYYEPLDKDWAQVCLSAYKKDIPLDLQPEGIQGKTTEALLQAVYGHTRLTTEAGAKAIAADIRSKGIAAITDDPAFQLEHTFRSHYQEKLLPTYQAAFSKVEPALKLFTEARREAEPMRKFYPDANFTLRVAYGQVSGYEPRDGVSYKPFTFVDGVLQKRDTTIEEFNAPQRLVQLVKAKDFGRYADAQGKLPVAFAASNHTTGGNSGSPVLDAYGRLIGTNFDRCWEGTMSDLDYDPAQCRNISVDIRYTLWVIDKFAGAGYLLAEMDIR